MSLKDITSHERVLTGYANICSRILTCSREAMNRWMFYRQAINEEGKILLNWGINKKPVSKACKLMIVIPVYKRGKHLHALLTNLSKQKESLGSLNSDDVLIVVSEMDEEPNHAQSAMDFGALYHYVPSHTTLNGQKVELGFNKSYAMNAAIWHNFDVVPHNILFHDVDIIMGDDWLKDVLLQIDELRKEKGSEWFCQTIGERKVEYVSEENSIPIFEGKQFAEDLNDKEHVISEYWPDRCPPGGSVMVPMELFVLSGGYDEFLFKGYSPEDSQFLQACLRLIDPDGNAKVDALKTKARSFHLYHPTSEFSNEDLTLLHLHHDSLNDENLQYTFYVHIMYKGHESRILTQWSSVVSQVIPHIPMMHDLCFMVQPSPNINFGILRKFNPAAFRFYNTSLEIRKYNGFYHMFHEAQSNGSK